MLKRLKEGEDPLKLSIEKWEDIITAISLVVSDGSLIAPNL